MNERGQLKKIGSVWKPRPGGKSLGTGSVTINGLRQRFVILKNDRKAEGSKDPDYNLLSSDEPEADMFVAHSRPATVPATTSFADATVTVSTGKPQQKSVLATGTPMPEDDEAAF